ncbi:MAG: hypothetical protein J6B64_00755 [Bacilli bacterium]|nr:hypothetical protein [Bacilli bacterium]MBP3635401.1 hypothetical protein [Bacilli bacterium]
MQKIEGILWITVISFIVFYLIPICSYALIKPTSDILANIFVLFINIVYSFIIGVVLTKKYGFKFYYSIIIGILFIPSAILVYNLSTIYFAIIYVLIALIGSLLFNGYKKVK